MAKRLPGGRTKRSARPATRNQAARRSTAEPPSVADSRAEHPRPAVEAVEHRTFERVPPTRAAPRRMAPRSRVASTPITTDDRYVVEDLKRIGILAAGAFTILGALAFILR